MIVVVRAGAGAGVGADGMVMVGIVSGADDGMADGSDGMASDVIGIGTGAGEGVDLVTRSMTGARAICVFPCATACSIVCVTSAFTSVIVSSV